MKSRTAAAKVLAQVVGKGRSLGGILAPTLAQLRKDGDRALAQELCYGVLRWYPRLAALLERLLSKPLKERDEDVRGLLLLGLYQIIYMRVPDHAAVGETVAAARDLGKPWAGGLVNAVLRNYLRDSAHLLEEVDQNEAAALAHPAWLLELLKNAWPGDWQAIVTANNQRPPMALRVNARHMERDAYLRMLVGDGIAAHPAPHTTHGVILEQPTDVERLPGFNEGWVSVQDSAAQLAATLLDVQPGQRVLDACAAPGGKAAHILESQPGVDLTALDNDAARLKRVDGNLRRLRPPGMVAVPAHPATAPRVALPPASMPSPAPTALVHPCTAEVLERQEQFPVRVRLIEGDAAQPAAWWDGVMYDRILLDAPCSATGVIRRHPDIKILRRPDDIAALAELQGRMLQALWPLLKPGGVFLYATCSILPQENEQQVTRFLAAQTDACEKVIDASWGNPREAGRQILPGENGMDGFYYACLQKT